MNKAMAVLLISMAATSLTQRTDKGSEEGRPLLKAQLGHWGIVTSVAFSPDGRQVLTGSSDETATLWDVATGRELRTFSGHSLSITSVAFSPDGRFILTGSWDRTARIWNAETGESLRSLTGHSKQVSSVAFSPDGRRIATGSSDTSAMLWDAETGRVLRVFHGCESDVMSVTFSPDGRQILTGSQDATARLWDTETGREHRTFKGHTNGVNSVAFSADGRWVVTGSSDATAKLWDALTGQEIHTFSGHPSSVGSVAFSPDGLRVLTGSSDRTARLWDVRTGQEIRAFRSTQKLSGVAFSPDGRRVLTGSWDQTASMWDVESAQVLLTFAGRSSKVISLAFSQDGRRLLAGDYNGTAKLWDTAAGIQIRVLGGHAREVTSVAFSSAGHRVLTGNAGDGTVRLWDTNTGETIRHISTGSNSVSSVAFSADASRILTGSGDLTAKLWDGESGRLLHTFRHTRRVTSVAFHPDGIRVLTGSGDHAARLWDPEAGQPVRTFSGHSDGVTSLAIAMDGRRLLTGSRDDTAKLWDLSSGQELRTFSGHSGNVRGVAFSPDVRVVLTGSDDRMAKVWDADTGRQLHTLAGHAAAVTSVVFSPDGRKALTGSVDGTVKVWDVSSGLCLSTLVSFLDGTWAVVDPSGRFDASNGGDVEGLHWVVGNIPIALFQLKERYYEPGLLAKVMGFNNEALRPVEDLDSPALFPAVELSPPPPGDSRLTIRLVNQGGGIGRTQVLVNGKEFTADARGPADDPNLGEVDLAVDLASAALRSDGDNKVEVIAWNAEGYLASRGQTIQWRSPLAREIQPPRLFAIVCGTSRYSSRLIDLTFPGKDAADMATAVRVSAGRLFGTDKVRLRLLTDYAGADAVLPSMDNLRKAFEAAAREATPDDILLVYLSGHGTTAPDGEYWYLTREATTTNLTDPQVRARSGVSSSQLTEWVKAIPVTKQVMILDTCAAGAVTLGEPRALSSDQVRAIERLKDRTGLHVLMGSSADARSYEATRYGQGLLTYALLQGMRGAALRDNEFVDVARLFGFAVDEVPRLAELIRRVQKPILSASAGGSFDIGQLTSADKPLVPLSQERPMILRANVQMEMEPFQDSLGLSQRIDRGLRERSYPQEGGGRIVFVDDLEFPGAFHLTGRYRRVGELVTLRVYLLEDGQRRHDFEVTGAASDPDALAWDVVMKTEKLLLRH